MRTLLKIFAVLLFLAGFTALLLSLTADKTIPLLQPEGPIARPERDLMITAFALMLTVVLPVFFLTAFFAWKYRASNTKARYTPNWEHNAVEEFVWWAV
ncbi:MAG: ubiquinol oxidase subunit 2, partial [Candidatus Parcubacteria bacterium]